MQRLSETIIQVGLVSLWRFNLIKGERFQEQLSRLICRKDPVFVKYPILRNYHCFYMPCDASAENVQRFKLGNARTFHYLNQSNCYELEGVDDSKEYIATRKAMDIVGINSSEPKDEKSRFHLRTAVELFIQIILLSHQSLRIIMFNSNYVVGVSWKQLGSVVLDIPQEERFYQIGETKVFLRAGQMADPDARMSGVLRRFASIIQRKVCSHLSRRSFVSMRRSAIQIQAACR
ncbi:unnamed protein product, partial [Vitis vinifera]